MANGIPGFVQLEEYGSNQALTINVESIDKVVKGPVRCEVWVRGGSVHAVKQDYLVVLAAIRATRASTIQR